MTEMRRASVGSVLAVVALLVGPSAPASAKKKLAVKGARHLHTVSPSTGYVDDPLAFSPDGRRYLYVHTDTGSSAELVVANAASGKEEARIDLKRFTLHPKRVEFAPQDGQFFVWSENAKTGSKTLALIDAQGAVKKTFGPAMHIHTTTYKGSDVVSVYDISAVRPGKARKRPGQPSLRHKLSLFDARTGKSVGKPTTVEVDDTDYSKKLGFRIKYFAADYSLAVGIKDGEWDKKEDQRSPDSAGTFDMREGRFVSTKKISNVLEHRRLLARLSSLERTHRTVVPRNDLTGLDYLEDGVFKPVPLAEPFHHYDAKSLQLQRTEQGGVFFSLQIDPVHPDAAAKRRAVTPYIDLYEYDPLTGFAVRRARFAPASGRKYRWSASSTHWALLQRHVGFDRGGTDLHVMKLSRR